jgi:hypothetical protein
VTVTTAGGAFAPTLATCRDVEGLVPGSVDGLYGDADRIDALSRSLAEHARELRAAAPDQWTGSSADGWTANRGRLADTLEVVSEVHATAAAVLRAHAETISGARARASVALDLYERGCALTRAAGMVPALTALPAANDPGANHRAAAQALLAVARESVAESGRAAAAVLDGLGEGMPDGRWHAGDFMAGIGSWIAGMANSLWKFSLLRAAIDGGGYARDLRAQADGLQSLWDATMADPIGAGEHVLELQELHDRPAEWWGHLAPDLALTAAGSAGVWTKGLGAVGATEDLAAGGAFVEGAGAGTLGAPLATQESAVGVDISSATWAQKSFSERFSKGGLFAGHTIDSVAGSLQSGALTPKDVPIDVILRDGNTLILNTRSAQALIRAEIPRDAWTVIDRTGQMTFEERLTGQLTRNGLTSLGTDLP